MPDAGKRKQVAQACSYDVPVTLHGAVCPLHAEPQTVHHMHGVQIRTTLQTEVDSSATNRLPNEAGCSAVSLAGSPAGSLEGSSTG